MIPVLEKSPYAYVSPLRSDGAQSKCHGEVWFAWLDGAIVTTTSATSWKARALAQGLDRARIWVGNYGRWKHPGGNNEACSVNDFSARDIILRDQRDCSVLDPHIPNGIETGLRIDDPAIQNDQVKIHGGRWRRVVRVTCA